MSLSSDLFDCVSYNYQKDDFDNLNDIIFNDSYESPLNEIIIPSESTSDQDLEQEEFNLDIMEDIDVNIDFLLNDEFEDIDQDDEVISQKTLSNKYKNRHKSPLLPYTVQDLIPKKQNISQCSKSHLKNEDLCKGKAGERIRLSEEECRILLKDGYRIPTHFPLTKTEERIIKTVRRKIRNKISAKISRSKKATYVECLEIKIANYERENTKLKQELSDCQKEKFNLYNQVMNLQKQLSKFIANSPTSATSIMLLLFTFVLIFSPSFDPRVLLGNQDSEVMQKHEILPGRSRVLMANSEQPIIEKIEIVMDSVASHNNNKNQKYDKDSNFPVVNTTVIRRANSSDL